jgi:polyhydroxybutyrate depolymerase
MNWLSGLTGRYFGPGDLQLALCWFIPLVTLAGCALSTAIQAPGQALSLQTLQVGDVPRSYYVHRPATVHEPGLLPVVLVLHGGGKADGDETAARTGYLELADRYGFIAVYPNGMDAQWNDGRGRTWRRNSGNRDADDVGFISALIDHLVASDQADPARVYVTGLSNGGMMTLRLGCELDSRLAAIAPVIANMPKAIAADCRPEGPLPVLLMNGTGDPLVPWEGGQVSVFRKERGEVLSTNATLGFWVGHNDCAAKPDVTVLPDMDPDDGSTVRVIRYSGPGNDCDVVLYAIEGGGHTFPGSPGRNMPRLLGNRNEDIDAAAVIWAFFSRHRNAQ